jgi:hypothetical protein
VNKIDRTLTDLAGRTGVPAHRIGMFATLLTLPVVSALVATLA